MAAPSADAVRIAQVTNSLLRETLSSVPRRERADASATVKAVATSRPLKDAYRRYLDDGNHKSASCMVIVVAGSLSRMFDQATPERRRELVSILDSCRSIELKNYDAPWAGNLLETLIRRRVVVDL